jgi:hypothetical protein
VSYAVDSTSLSSNYNDCHVVDYPVDRRTGSLCVPSEPLLQSPKRPGREGGVDTLRDRTWMDPLFRDISELSHVLKFGIPFHPSSSLESRRAYPWVTEGDSLFINVRVKISRSSAAHGQHFRLKKII